ncbi:MAG: hypothetical protein C4315_04615 [Chloroflexota bacterium]
MSTEPRREPRPSYSVLIRELPVTERPRERLLRHGPSVLSDHELIAIIWRTGTRSESVLDLARRVLTRFGGLHGLAGAAISELAAEKGIGQVKAVELKAALELGRRLATLQPGERPVVKSPAEVAALVMGEMAWLAQEQLRVLLLNSKNQVLGSRLVYQGSVNAAQVRIGELFREAIRENCPAVILVHNHPSGDPTPSPEDVQMTRAAVEAGRLLDIAVLDHVVVGQGRFCSIRERHPRLWADADQPIRPGGR